MSVCLVFVGIKIKVSFLPIFAGERPAETVPKPILKRENLDRHASCPVPVKRERIESKPSPAIVTSVHAAETSQRIEHEHEEINETRVDHTQGWTIEPNPSQPSEPSAQLAGIPEKASEVSVCDKVNEPSTSVGAEERERENLEPTQKVMVEKQESPKSSDSVAVAPMRSRSPRKSDR